MAKINQITTKAIIFDLGGVIIHPVVKPFSVKMEVLYGIPKEKIRKAFYKYLGELELGKISENEYWRKFSKELKIKNDSKRFKKLLRSFLIVRPEMIKLLKKLKRKYKIALLTNAAKNWLEYTIQRYSLENFFDAVISSSKYKTGKPSIQRYLNREGKLDFLKIYKLVVKRLKINSNECLFIDDKKENLFPAKKLGMKTILFKTERQLKKQLLKLKIKV